MCWLYVDEAIIVFLVVPRLRPRILELLAPRRQLSPKGHFGRQVAGHLGQHVCIVLGYTCLGLFQAGNLFAQVRQQLRSLRVRTLAGCEKRVVL